MIRRGFTLIEILVSIGIFAVAASLMFGALFGATEVFRRGEAARQAGDEATAVMAALQDDLARLVPLRLRDGLPAPEAGHIKAVVSPAGDGNCSLSMIIVNPDRDQVRMETVGTVTRAVGDRIRVTWQLSGDQLTRTVDVLRDNGTTHQTLPAATITRGVLHFGVWVEVAQQHRQITESPSGPVFGWEVGGDNALVPMIADVSGTGTPLPAYNLDTNVPFPATPPFYIQPDAMRVSLVLTGGGRFATRGTLVDASGTDWRISGIKALPTISGSLLRVGNEWIRYDDFRGGLLRGVQRGQLRSDKPNHSRGEAVLAGQPFSLVVALPR